MMQYDTMLTVYDTLEDLIKSTQPDVELPVFPMPTEDIESIDDLLKIVDFIKAHNLSAVSPKYSRLLGIESVVREFNSMIGLEKAKETMATQILALCSSPETKPGASSSAFLHTVIYGPPGCGKTTMAEFLAKIYVQTGTLSSGRIVHGNRANMIGEYIGETAMKTEKILTSALGGVFFIDEAYQLGHAADGNRCPFAYECINTLTQFITKHVGEVVIILAGYEKDIRENVFAQNVGLDRRFPWSYTLETASPENLVEIFRQQAQRADYTVDESALSVDLFRNNKELFAFSGGDTKTLFDKCLMKHVGRMFALLQPDHVLSKVDIEKGFQLYKKHRKETDKLAPELQAWYS